jgi:hypothetical protein
MKNQISFTTGLFDSGQIKPGSEGMTRLGYDLARWLNARSGDDEFTFGEPSPFGQDGWTEKVTANGESFTLGFGLMPGTRPADHAEWLITIKKERGWNPFGPTDSALRGRLCDLIHNVLRDEGEIREVHWG